MGYKKILLSKLVVFACHYVHHKVSDYNTLSMHLKSQLFTKFIVKFFETESKTMRGVHFIREWEIKHEAPSVFQLAIKNICQLGETCQSVTPFQKHSQTSASSQASLINQCGGYNSTFCILLAFNAFLSSTFYVYPRPAAHYSPCRPSSIHTIHPFVIFIHPVNLPPLEIPMTRILFYELIFNQAIMKSITLLVHLVGK